MNQFDIAETDHFRDQIQNRDYSTLYVKLTGYIYPQLRINPFFGSNIKKLKGELEGVYRYRIGKYRLFYTIDIEQQIVFTIDIDARKDAYRKK